MSARTVFKETEAQFQSAVIGLARFHGWRVAHFRPAMNSKGQWRTPVQADGAGFPDLVLVRPPRLLIVELKTDKGRVQPAQVEWLQALTLCGVEATVWRPKDWPAVEATLARDLSGAQTLVTEPVQITGAPAAHGGSHGPYPTQDELKHGDWE